MNRSIAVLSLLVLFAWGATVSGQGQYDFFWSDKNVGEGGFNGDLVIEVEVGDVVPLYLYWSTNGPADRGINVGCAVDISMSASGIIRFDYAATTDFDIMVDDFDIGNRWLNDEGGGGLVGEAYEIYDDYIDMLWAFTVTGGPGIVESNNGSGPFLDTGYNFASDGFQFGSLEFTALAPGEVQIITVTDESGCVSGGDLLDVLHSTVTVIVNQDLVLGDVNLDGVVNLLDVAPFVQILSDLGYQAEADINQDGAVDLLDVPLFIDLL